jgi:hypothetical protein
MITCVSLVSVMPMSAASNFAHLSLCNLFMPFGIVAIASFVLPRRSVLCQA